MSTMKRALRRLAVVGLLVGPGAAWAQGAKREVEIKAQPTVDIQAPERRSAQEKKGPNYNAEINEMRRGRSTEAMAEEKWKEAFSLLKKLIQNTSDDDPAKPELYFRLSEMYWERSAAITIRAFDNEEKCLKANTPAASCTADKDKLLAKSAENREEAIGVYKEIVKKFPNYPRLDSVLFALGYNFQQKGEPENAKKIYVELIKRYPKSDHVPDTLVNVGEIFFDAGQVDQALKAYEKVATGYKDSDVYGYALYKLGWCYYNLGDFKGALGQFLKVVEHTNQTQTRNKSNRTSLKREALRDLVRAYVNIEDANPNKAVDFFKKVAPDDYLTLSEDLAERYSLTGQFDKSNRLYRQLITLQPKSYKVVTYQKQIAFNTRSIGNQVETVKEVKRLTTLWASVKDAKDADPKRVEDDRKGIEELLRSQAVTYHQQALKTKSNEDFAIAYELYKDYVDTFPTGENAYTMTFYYGELLYRLQKWQESATMYERTLALKPDGEFTQDAAHGQVLAYKKLLEIKQDAGDTSQLTNLESNATSADIPAAKPLPETHVKFIKACDVYSKYVKESEYLVDIEYDAARIYYDFNQFDEAIPRFKNISEKHSKHRLAIFAANLLLDTYNLKKDFDTLEKQVDTFLAIYTPQQDPAFYELLTKLKQQSTFKKCQGVEATKQYTKAGECYEAYAKRFPQSEYVGKALYNAGLNYERDKRVEKAINVRVALVNTESQGEGDLQSKALYQIGGNLHALAIYSQASKFYELYAEKFPKEENAKDALRNAAVFRQGLGENEQALQNYNAYLNLIGGQREEAADVFFSMGLIYEKQEDWNKAIEHFNEYLRKYGKVGKIDRVLEAYTHIGNAYEQKKDETNAQKNYSTAFNTFSKLSPAEIQGLTTGLAAVAEARFKMGEFVYRQFAAVKLKVFPYKNVKKFLEEMTKIITRKSELIAEGRRIYLEVIEFKSPNWAIAALARIGELFQTLANDIYDAPTPGSFDEEQSEIYKGAMAEKAQIPESKAIESYVLCMKKAQELRWFNTWSDKCEKELSKLNPKEYRYNAEVRARPTHMGASVIRQDFIPELPKAEDDQ